MPVPAIVLAVAQEAAKAVAQAGFKSFARRLMKQTSRYVVRAAGTCKTCHRSRKHFV